MNQKWPLFLRCILIVAAAAAAMNHLLILTEAYKILFSPKTSGTEADLTESFSCLPDTYARDPLLPLLVFTGDFREAHPYYFSLQKKLLQRLRVVVAAASHAGCVSYERKKKHLENVVRLCHCYFSQKFHRALPHLVLVLKEVNDNCLFFFCVK